MTKPPSGPPTRKATTSSTRVNFAVGNDSSIPYMSATFEQDNLPPHHWRGYLSPWTEDLGELGDLPENVYPNETFPEACQALYEAYSERHRTNAG